MTNSTITREQLIEKLKHRIAVTEKYPHLEEAQIDSQIFKIALAAMDGEPVAYTDERNLGYIYRGRETAYLWGKQNSEAGDIPLYRHAQQPVVPVVPNGLRLALSNAGIAAPESDEMLAATCEKHIQALVTWVKDRKPFQSAPVVPSFEEWLSAANRKPLGWVKDAMREAYDACRAAMLAVTPQSPGSEPATVPGKWIPVSERMPEDEQEVLTINRMGHRFVSFFGKHSGLYFDRLDAPAACCIEHVLVTHWMPLPAAPQEVK